MRVGIDLDGVCYDFSNSVREYVTGAGILAREACGEAVCWEFYESWGLPLNEFLDVCHAGVDHGTIFTYGEPYRGVVEAFQMLRANGHSIHVVTDRTFGSPGASAQATIAWLQQHGLGYDSITFSPDKTVAHLDVMVDDKPENYAALVAAGVDAYLLTRAWNRHVEGAKRVLDLYHFAEVVCS